MFTHVHRIDFSVSKIHLVSAAEIRGDLQMEDFTAVMDTD